MRKRILIIGGVLYVIASGTFAIKELLEPAGRKRRRPLKKKLRQSALIGVTWPAFVAGVAADWYVEQVGDLADWIEL